MDPGKTGKADAVSNRHTHGEIASDWALGMGGVLVGDGGGQAEGGSLRNTDIQATQDVATMWGLPLQFHFVGLWLAVHRVRDPTVLSAWGSVGGSTKAQLGPVLSCGGCWPAGRTAGSGPASLRMPTQHARKTKKE